ncbi:MAG TPA: hypothetical protein VKT77_15415 [Chthonomonadaceae bacterium]|nr:hypothetical protein [Chthonomonadaceae bacterium]
MRNLLGALAATITVALANPAGASAQTKAAVIVATVHSIVGKVYWRPTMARPEVLLDPVKDRSRPICFGEWVKASPGCKLNVWVPHGSTAIVQTIATPANETAQWRTFARRPTAAQLALLKIISEASLLGGRPRDAGPLYAPADRSVQRLDKLEIRWTPTPAGVTTRLALTDDTTGASILAPQSVDGAVGRAPSEPFVAALRALPERARRHRLSLSIRTNGREFAVHFTLMDAVAEAALAAQLAQTDSLPAGSRRLGRVGELAAAGLLNEVAAECEAALAEEPGNETVRVTAIVADEQIGYAERALELRKSLPPGTSVPDIP